MSNIIIKVNAGCIFLVLSFETNDQMHAYYNFAQCRTMQYKYVCMLVSTLTIQTTLARIIARVAHQKLNTKFVQLSATTAGVKDVKEVVQAARNDKIMFKRNTILFIDEIHRFNKLQQVFNSCSV